MPCKTFCEGAEGVHLERAVAQFYWEGRPFSSGVLEIEVGRVTAPPCGIGLNSPVRHQILTLDNTTQERSTYI